jgi:hypothetical protein
VLAAGPAVAGPTRSFRLTSYKDFDEGEAKGVQLTSNGDVLPGLDAQHADIAELLAYTALRIGDVLYIGTGDDGALWSARGKDKPKKLMKLDGVLVSALAAARNGDRLFAGVSPTGKIFLVDKLRDGTPRSRELVKLDSEHVWALAWNEDKHTLYAATGASGKLYAIDVDLDKATAKAKVIWSSGEKHLLSLARTDDGALLVGSADQAILYRVRPQGSSAEVRVVHDFEGEEVRAILRGQGTTYVAVNDFKGQGLPVVAAVASKSSRTPAPAAGGSTATISLGAGGSVIVSTPVGHDRKGKGAVYRVDDDGRIEQLHALTDGYFTALARDANGTLWEASGSNGRVYQVRDDNAGRTIATALDLPERQVLFLDLASGTPMLGTGDAAALYRLGAAQKDAVYLSKALDATWSARWGKLHFGGGGVELSTRTGNTLKPDATWSAWQSLGSPESRGNGGEGRIQSPSGRFIQLRARLTTAKSVLRDLVAYYLPQNQRARVTEVVVGEEPSGTRHLLSLQKSPHAHNAILHVRWKTENPDDDELVYRVSFREESDPTWHLIGGPEPITKTDLDWNTEPLPDGHYLIRVVASDERANTKEDTLESSLVSSPALVDNKRPEVGPIEVTFPAAPKNGPAPAPIANGRAKDSASTVTELAYSVDGGDFVAAAPKDGVFDDLEESFSIRLPQGLSSGRHTLAVRAVDSADNLGATQVTFRVK